MQINWKWETTRNKDIILIRADRGERRYSTEYKNRRPIHFASSPFLYLPLSLPPSLARFNLVIPAFISMNPFAKRVRAMLVRANVKGLNTGWTWRSRATGERGSRNGCFLIEQRISARESLFLSDEADEGGRKEASIQRREKESAGPVSRSIYQRHLTPARQENIARASCSLNCASGSLSSRASREPASFN